MAHEDGGLYWHDPDPRAVFPLNELRPDRKTAQQLRSVRLKVTFDQRFDEVIRACADREGTWIDERIIASYINLHRSGHAHSVEVWREDVLAGGIYGVSIGAAFFGESMFSRSNNMGKVAFFALVEHLQKNGFTLFDTQYINPFTEQLGAIEIRKENYLSQLSASVLLPVVF